MGRSSILFLLSALTTLWGAPTRAEEVKIPLSAISQPPANDLIYNGTVIDSDTAMGLVRTQGFDLSTLDPFVKKITPAGILKNDFWTPDPLPISNADQFEYPTEENVTVDYQDVMDSPDGTYRVQVKHNGKPFRLIVDPDNHQALASAALLRKLGYPVDSPQWYKTLKLRFPNKEKYDLFLSDLPYFAHFLAETWVTEKNEETLTLTLKDVNLESPRIYVPTFYLGRIDKEAIGSARATRAMIGALALLNYQNSSLSLNIYSWELGRIVNEEIVLDHLAGGVFNGSTDIHDLRWIARKIAKLTRVEINEIIKSAKYPDDVSELLVEKFIARRNQLMELCWSPKTRPIETQKIKYRTKVNVGSVKKGELTQQHYDGYAMKLSVDDPESPLRWKQLKHFIKLEVIAQAIVAANDWLNKKIQIQSPQSGVEARQKERVDDFIKYLVDNNCALVACQPYVMPVTVWSKPFGGFNFALDRSIVTGTYYGSDSKIQLVDTLSVGANAGTIAGIDGIKSLMDKFGATAVVGYQRAFTHVRPMPSLEATKKEPWKNLVTPLYFKKTTKLLKNTDASGDGKDETVLSALKEFLEDLRDGEVFTITDAFFVQAGANYNYSLLSALGSDFSKFAPSVGVGLTGDWAIVKRTMFTRHKDQIEVYENTLKTKAFGPSVSANFWIELAKSDLQLKSGKAHTQALMIDLTPVTDADKQTNADFANDRKNILSSVRSILRKNDVDLAQGLYPTFTLDHKLNSAKKNAKVALWNWAGYKENHLVTLTPPEGTDERTLFSTRKLRLRGSNPYGLFGQGLSKVTNIPGLLDSGPNQNPSGTIFGRSSFSSVRTDAELTEGTEFKPVIFLQDTFSGWSISKNKMLKILTKIENDVKDFIDGNPIFRKDVFNSTKKFQSYELQSTVFVHPAGVKKLMESIKKSKRGQRLLSEAELEPSIKHRRKYLIWLNKIVHRMSHQMKTSEMMKIIGKENFFFQARLSAFRVGDESGDQADYYSDVIGHLLVEEPENGDPFLSFGPFRDLKVESNGVKWRISNYELEATYYGSGL